jgi:hypothetical protein
MPEEVPTKVGPANNYEGDDDDRDNTGPFKKMEDFDTIRAHYDGTVGKTDDPTYTRKTVIQVVNGGHTMEKTASLPSYEGKGLSNDDYHKAAGGGDIPMTYGT